MNFGYHIQRESAAQIPTTIPTEFVLNKKLVSGEVMEEWDIEWMESDPTYLWVEISTIWSLKEFNTRLQFIAVVKGRGNDVVTRVPNGMTEGEMEDSR